MHVCRCHGKVQHNLFLLLSVHNVLLFLSVQGDYYVRTAIPSCYSAFPHPPIVAYLRLGEQFQIVTEIYVKVISVLTFFKLARQ